MNPNTGELIRVLKEGGLPAGFERIEDKRLAMIASAKLARDPQPVVNLKSQSPLAQWAKKKRLAKIAAKSRRRNRK